MSENTFETLSLKDNLLRGIYTYGFEKPSVIQSKAIPVLMTGVDIIAQAQSGTGKTGTFVIGSLNNIDENEQNCQVIIVSPTRELAQQSFDVVLEMSKYLKINAALCIGGTNIRESLPKLRKAHIIVATPGRLLNMLDQNEINAQHLKMLVVDEADEMLSQGFMCQLQDLISEFIPNDTQIALFSATFPDELKEVTEKFMRSPQEIYVKRDELTLEGIQQYYVNVSREEYKFSTLCDLYQSITITQAIIYLHSKQRVQTLYDKLTSQNYAVSMIHGDMSYDERSEVMRDFRKGDARILISTDLLARGIDVQQVSLVINYDLPRNKECYIHRIGRSGRFGRKGIAINFIAESEVRGLHAIEQFYQTQIDELPANIHSLL
jgi:superfamily II DNA/RNA helicase